MIVVDTSAMGGLPLPAPAAPDVESRLFALGITLHPPLGGRGGLAGIAPLPPRRWNQRRARRRAAISDPVLARLCQDDAGRRPSEISYRDVDECGEAVTRRFNGGITRIILVDKKRNEVSALVDDG